MISEKIKQQINELPETDEIKHLMLKILEEEDRGIYKYKDALDKLIKEFIKESGR